MVWKLHHNRETVSTNLDARAGRPFAVFTADFQTAGRGRLDHRWVSPPGANLLMSVVLPVGKAAPEEVATLPLVVGLAVVLAVRSLGIAGVMLKWPNDVLVEGRKVAGILCERNDDRVIAGIGVNVQAQEFAPELAGRATFLGACPRENGAGPQAISVAEVRERVLAELATVFGRWADGGFAELYAEFAAIDYLRGQSLEVWQTDDDPAPLVGRCGGILDDGSLAVGKTRVYAGEAHVAKFEGNHA